MKLTLKQLNHVPQNQLYDIMMGLGSIFRSGKAIIISVKDYNHSLSCGCPGSKSVLVIDSQGNKVYQELSHSDLSKYSNDEYFSSPFQGKEFDSEWEEFYNKYPFHRPILMNN